MLYTILLHGTRRRHLQVKVVEQGALHRILVRMPHSKPSSSSFAWISATPPAGQAEKLAEIYKGLGVPATGEGLDHVLRIHAAMPDTLTDHLAFYQGILRRPGPLSRVECEILGVVVSQANKCDY